MGLSLQHISKYVGRQMHLEDIHVDFDPGSLNIILGRTLAGKTSLLRIMAGLDRPSNGKLVIDGQDMTRTSVRKRSVAMVYQQFINYPSLTVYKNIASPLRMSGMDNAEIDRRVRETAAILHMEDLLDRMPAELSGGQQQRTAIARALVKDADLLLMDEPLVNLDYKLREELRQELRQIFQQREAIVVYTTTEPVEALMLGGNIVVIDEGRVLQTGGTFDVYNNPARIKVAEVFSDPPINRLPGRIDQNEARLGENVPMALNGHIRGLAEGDYLFAVRANHLSVSGNSDRDIQIPGVVELSEINGSETFIHVRHGNTRLVVQEEGIHKYRIGDGITIHADPGSFFVYDQQGSLKASPFRGVL